MVTSQSEGDGGDTASVDPAPACGAGQVLMLDNPQSRRFHLYRDCVHITGSEKELRQLPRDDREVQRALLCSWCQGERTRRVRHDQD